ncbi:MAG: PEGA domain-containing protein, partial [Deltaproteobacteria bacterium]|nr:PEGA domain-containing protein [Deltaproteobacteria bacterium]
LQGSLRITTQPADARIFLDKRLVGVGSYTSTVPVGQYALTVEKGKRPAVARTLDVNADRTTNVNIAMPLAPKSGRLELLIASSTAGGLLGGTAFGSVFDSQGGAALGVGAGLGIGFVGGFFGIPDDIPVSSSSLIIGSSLWMATEGVLLTALFSCDRTKMEGGATDEDCADPDVFASVGAIAGVTGLVGSALWGHRLKLSAGDVALINSGATWGLAAGGLLWSTFDEEPEARDPLLLAGLNLGLLASGIIAAQVEVTRARSALIDLSGLGGLLVGVAAARLAEETGAGIDRADHFALVGMAAGLIAGSFLTRGIGEADGGSSSLRPATQSITDAAGRSNLGLGAALEF